MMIRKYILVTIVITLLLIIVFLVKGINGLINSFVQMTPEKTASSPPTLAPPQSPKTFKFDSSTDLKMELEKVNPQVLDSDFE